MHLHLSCYVTNCPNCQVAKGNTYGPICHKGFYNKLMDLLCIDFTKNDQSKDGKEYVSVLTSALSKFNQVYITPNPKEDTTVTITKV